MKNEIELKYGSFSVLMFHIRYTLDQNLQFMKDEEIDKIDKKLEEIIWKFMERNKLTPHKVHA